jgi:hypothetical protein
MRAPDNLIAEAKFLAEIRDVTRHRWRVGRGEIPAGAPMATSWSGDTRWGSLARHFPERSAGRELCETMALVTQGRHKEG